MTVRCVVFDVDDTLYLERDYVRSGFVAADRAATQHLGTTGFLEQAWALFLAGARGDIIDRALAELGVAARPQEVKRLVRCYREHTPAIALLPDARRALDGLSSCYALAGLTDGPAESQHGKISALELARWLDPVIVTAELGRGCGKPNPLGFELIADAVGATGNECAYVADNPLKDFAGPRRLGWHTIRIRRPGSLHADVEPGIDVDVELSTLADLGGVLAAL